MADAIVTELGEYVKAMNLEGTIRPMVEAMLKERPDDPTQFMYGWNPPPLLVFGVEYLLQSQNAKQSKSAALIVRVTHGDPTARQYLEMNSFSSVVEDIGEELLKTKPNDMRLHIVQFLQNKKV